MFILVLIMIFDWMFKNITLRFNIYTRIFKTIIVLF
jgi:hypothetical protein